MGAQGKTVASHISGCGVSLAQSDERVLSEAQKHIRQSVVRGQPFGPTEWVGTMIDRFGLASTVRSEGRPKKLLVENGS